MLDRLLVLTFDTTPSILLTRRTVDIQNKRARSRAIKNRNDSDRTNLLQGTLDMMVLKALAAGPMHGWGIAETLEQITEGAFQVNQGSIYPALQRLKKRGLLTCEWGRTEDNRRARYYSMTSGGRGELHAVIGDWRRTAKAVELVLAWQQDS